MNVVESEVFRKLKVNLPWMLRYPWVRTKSVLSREMFAKKRLIFIVANHFEPAWSPHGVLNLDGQKRALDDYYKLARKTGEATRDADGTKFRHTNFYPAEQYHPELLETMAQMQAEGLGEVEIHLHHGLEKPDTSENLRQTLSEFRDILANEHHCLSRFDGIGEPKYAFVHGNLALANSCGGKYCGVDEEMQILEETGCYADLTLPSAPDETQVAIFNEIYESTLPFSEKIPHREGKSVEVNGISPRLPLIFTGPLILNWTRKIKGFPVPRIDEGALAANQSLDLKRLNRWMKANITVKGYQDWVFIKLYCHGFFQHDQSACIGEDVQRFFGEVIENGEKNNQYTVHFATAREAFNMVMAAVDGQKGNPNDYRNYRLKSIMDEKKSMKSENGKQVAIN